jgi:ABC-type phosphate transport system substrate-binding protein
MSRWGVLLLFITLSVQADMVVIVAEDNPVSSLSRKQVVDLFMGRKAEFPDGKLSTPIDLAAGSPLRQRFYQSLTGKSEAQVDAYWAQLVFAGRMKPPPQLESAEAVLRAVRSDRSAIGFIERSALAAGVKVVLDVE